MSDVIGAIIQFAEEYRRLLEQRVSRCVEGVVIEMRPRALPGRMMYIVRLLPKDRNVKLPPLIINDRSPVFATIDRIYRELRQPHIKVCFDEYGIPLLVEEVKDDVSNDVIKNAEARGLVHTVTISMSQGLVVASGYGNQMITMDTSSLVYRKVELCGGSAKAVLITDPATNRVAGAIVERCVDIRVGNAMEAIHDVIQEVISSATQQEAPKEEPRREEPATPVAEQPRPADETSHEEKPESEEFPSEEALREIEKELEQLMG